MSHLGFLSVLILLPFCMGFQPIQCLGTEEQRKLDLESLIEPVKLYVDTHEDGYLWVVDEIPSLKNKIPESLSNIPIFFVEEQGVIDIWFMCVIDWYEYGYSPKTAHTCSANLESAKTSCGKAMELEPILVRED